MSLRRSFAIATAAVIVSVSSLALADDEGGGEAKCEGWFCDDEGNSTPVPKVGEVGTVTIPGVTGADGILSGTIQEVVPGDHLTLKLPNGELKTLKWAELLQLQISGKIVIGGGGTTVSPAPAPTTPAPTTVVIAPPPPNYAPPAPPAPIYTAPPAYDHSDDEPAPRKEFKDRWALGLRLNFLSPGQETSFVKDGPSMKDSVGSGTAFEGSLGYRFGPAWTLYGAFEYGKFRGGKAGGDGATSSVLALGMRANTNPEGLGFYFDIGLGYRWLTLKNTQVQGIAQDASTQFSGVDLLRLGIGLSLASSQHVSWNLGLTGAAGSFSKLEESGCSMGGDCKSIPEERRGTYAFGGLALGGQFDL
jgi:hypothetical protein